MTDYIAEQFIDTLVAERDKALAEAADLRRQLDECQAQRDDAELDILRLSIAFDANQIAMARDGTEIIDLRRQLAEVQARRDAARDDYRRAISQRETLDRQLLMERVARKYAEAETAVSPALIEEYAQACCHDAGVHGFVTIDWPQWLRKRQEEVQP